MTPLSDLASVGGAHLPSLDGLGLPARLPFTKMQGIGNDYVYLEEFTAPMADPSPLARRMSDRHFGVGGDGIVLMGPSEKADFRMRMFNADGSEAEMCGNAIRCVGKYLFERGFTKAEVITVETLAGVRTLHLMVERGKVSLVRVAMGQPKFAPPEIPVRAEGDDFIDRPVLVDGRVYQGTAVSMGNPHLVVPVPAINSLGLPRLGPLFEHHSLFPNRINIEFIEVPAKDLIRMRVWERGAGETLACGTGACACLAACAVTGLTGRSARVELLGGALLVQWDENDNQIYMTGPAAFVFDGEFLTV